MRALKRMCNDRRRGSALIPFMCGTFEIDGDRGHTSHHPPLTQISACVCVILHTLQSRSCVHHEAQPERPTHDEHLMRLSSRSSCFKGDVLCKIHFYKVFEHSCVAAVCENIQPIMLKIHQLIYL